MKIAVIGACGHIGYATSEIAKNPDLDLVAAAPATETDSPENIKKYSENFGCEIYDSYQKMLDKVKPEVAVIGTRYDMNGIVSLECLDRGIHCFTEKAIASNMNLLEKISASATQNNTQIIGMHGMRYSPNYLAAYKALKSGIIGTPMLFTGQKSYKFGNARPEFYKKREFYGGTIPWVAIHAIDWAYWFMGDFSTVFAQHSNQNNFNYENCEASSIIAFSFKNGGMGTINADYYQPQKSQIHGDDQMRIASDKGIINVKYGKAFVTTHDQEEQELELEEQGSFFGDFCRELQGTGKCLLSMEDTISVTKLAILARDSADTGKVIEIE